MGKTGRFLCKDAEVCVCHQLQVQATLDAAEGHPGNAEDGRRGQLGRQEA